MSLCATHLHAEEHHVKNALLTNFQDSDFLALKNRVFKYLENSWCSAEKAELIMNLIFAIRPQVCVEIGAFSGSSVLPVAAVLKYLKVGHIYAIDAWSNKEAVRNIDINDPNYDWWSNVDMQNIKSQFNTLINQWALHSYCFAIHASSEMVIDQIPELDFLHLDGNFSEEGSLLDVQLFMPKVKPGGYILLSNVFVVVDNKLTKMASMWKIFDKCEIIHEIDNHAILFRKD